MKIMINMNGQKFQEYITHCRKPILVEFYAPYCVYCRRLAPIMEKIAEQFADPLVIGQVDIDREPALAQQEQIEIVPTLVLYQNGQAVGSIVAPASKAAIEAFLQEALGL